MKKHLFILLGLLVFTNFLYAQNNALHFDGVDDYVEMNSPIEGSGDFTFEAWFTAEPNDSEFYRIVSIEGPGTRFELGVDNLNVAYFVHPDNTNGTIHTATSSSVEDGLCHHIASVKSGTDFILYLDGQEIVYIENHFDSGFSLGDGSPMRLGRWGPDYWKGTIDEVRVWNVAKSQDEIIEGMTVPLQGLESNLTAYYDFNQGIDGGNNLNETILENKSGASFIFDGVLNNFSLSNNTSNWILSCSPIIEYCPLNCDVTDSEGFENFTLGQLPTVSPQPASGWFASSGSASIVADGCENPKSVELTGITLGIPNTLEYTAGSAGGNDNLLFEEGLFYCISLCAKVTSPENPGFLFFEFGDIAWISDLIEPNSGWVTFNLPFWQAGGDFSSIKIFALQSTSTIDFNILIDNISISEVAPPSQCQADFTYEFFDCGEVCFEDLSCGTDYTPSWSIDGEPVSLAGDCYTFESEGTYEVCLSIFTDGCESEHCEEIEVDYIQEPLALACSFSVTTDTDPEICGAMVEIPDPVISIDPCVGFGDYTEVRSDGLSMADPFPVGITTVTFTLSDDQGNSTSCSLTVTVVDEENPTIVCPMDPVVVMSNSPDGTVISWPIIEANDNCGVDSMYCSFDEEYVFPCGETEVWCFAIDSSGNVDSCSFLVVVNCVTECCGTFENLCESMDAGFDIIRDNCAITIKPNLLDTCQFIEASSDGIDLGVILYPENCLFYDFGTSGNYSITITYGEREGEEICFSKDTIIEICLDCVCDNELIKYEWHVFPNENHLSGKAVAVNADLQYSSTNTIYTAGGFDGSSLYGNMGIVSKGETDIFLAEMNSNGTYLPGRFLHLGGASMDHATVIELDNTNGKIIMGAETRSASIAISTIGGVEVFTNPNPYLGQYPTGTSQGLSDALILSINQGNFDVNWAINLSNHWNVTVNDLAVDQAGNLFATGSFRTDNNPVDFDPIGNNPTFTQFSKNTTSAYVAKYDLDGKCLWLKTFTDPSPLDNQLINAGTTSNAIDLDGNGNIYITGQVEEATNNGGGYVFNENGTAKPISVNSNLPFNHDRNGFILRIRESDQVVTWVEGNQTHTDYKGNTLKISGNSLYVGGRIDNKTPNKSGFLSHYDISIPAGIPVQKYHGYNGYEVEDIDIDFLGTVYVTGQGGLDVNLDVINNDPNYAFSSSQMGQKNGVVAKYTSDLEIIDGFISGSSNDNRFAISVANDGSQFSVMGNTANFPFYSDPQGYISFIGMGVAHAESYINTYKCKCASDEDECCSGLNANLKLENDISDACCYSLDIDNSAGIPIVQIEMQIVTQDWFMNYANVSSGYSISSGSNSLTFSSNLGAFPSGFIDDLASICPSAMTPNAPNQQEIIVKYYELGANGTTLLACQDTIITNCESDLNFDCVDVTNTSLFCDGDDDLSYSFNFDIINNSGFNANYVKLSGLPFDFGFCSCNANPLLCTCPSDLLVDIPNAPINPNGTSSGLCAKIKSKTPLLDPIDLCFYIGLQSTDFDSCCVDSTQICMTLEPCCNPCSSINSSIENITDSSNEENLCCYKLDLNYECGFDYFTNVDINLSNADIFFNQVIPGSNLEASVCSNSSQPQNICVSYSDPGDPGVSNVSTIPTGNYSNVVQFCLSSLSDANPIQSSINIDYYALDVNGDEVKVCSDNHEVSCDSNPINCALLTDAIIECFDVEQGIYKLVGQVTNLSNFDVDEILVGSNSPYSCSVLSPNVISTPVLTQGDSENICVLLKLCPNDPTVGPFGVTIGLKNSNDGTCCSGSEAIIEYFDIPECDLDTFSCPENLLLNGSMSGGTGGDLTNNLPSWNVGHGSPQVVTADGCAANGCLQMWGMQTTGESVYQNYNFVAGQSYMIEFCAKWLDNVPNQGQLRLRASNGTGSYVNCNSPDCEEILITPDLPLSWNNYISACWTPQNDYDRLLFSPWNQNTNANDGSLVSWVRVDDVCVSSCEVDTPCTQCFSDLTYDIDCIETDGTIDLSWNALCPDEEIAVTLINCTTNSVVANTIGIIPNSGNYTWQVPLPSLAPDSYQIYIECTNPDIAYWEYGSCFDIGDCVPECECEIIEEVNVFYEIGSNLNCGDTYTIPSVTQDIIISGNFDCIGDCDTSAVFWTLTTPSTPIYNGSTNTGFYSIQLDQNYFDDPGIYEFSVFGQCGMDACSECIIYIEILDGAICTCDGYSDVILTTANNEYTFDCTYDEFIEINECPQVDPILSYTGKVECSTACGFNGSVFNWTLEKDDVPYEIGGMAVLQGQVTTVNADGTYEIDLSSVPFWMPGKYRIGSNVNCNPATKCECYAEWIVPDNCGCECILDFYDNPPIINQPFSNILSCTKEFYLSNVGPCDEALWEWNVFGIPNMSQQQFANTVGNETVVFTGDDDVLYHVSVTVRRTQPDGTICEQSTAEIIPIECITTGTGGGHGFYHDGLLHTVIGDYNIDNNVVDDVIYISEIGDEEKGLDITFKETNGHTFTTFSPNHETEEIGSYFEYKLFGSLNDIPNSLIMTEKEEVVQLSGERFIKWSVDNVGVENNWLRITTKNGEIVVDESIPNNEAIYYSYEIQNNKPWETDRKIRCFHEERHCPGDIYDQEDCPYNIRLILESDGGIDIELEAGFNIELKAINPTDQFNYFSKAEMRWQGINNAEISSESIIMFEDQIQNHILGNPVFDAWQVDNKLGILNPPLNQYEGLQISWPFINSADLDEYGVYHEEEWEYEQGDFLGSLLFESFGKLNEIENQNLGRVEYEPNQDGAFITFDKGNLETDMVFVQVLESEGLVGEFELPTEGLRIELDPSVPYKVNNRGNGSDMDYDFGLYWLNPVQFNLNGEWYTGDELRIVTQESRLVEVMKFNILPRNFKEFTFINQTVRNCNCVVSLSVTDDLALGFEETINGNEVCVSTYVNFVHPCLSSSLTSFTWDWGDGTSDDVTTSPFDACHTYANDPSAYEISFTAEMFFGTRLCDSITVYSDGTTDLVEIDNSDFWKVYPNPLSNILTIESTYTTNKVTFINIYDINGKVVSRTKVSTALNETKVDFSNYQSGVYIIEVVDQNNITSFRTKIIKI